VSTLSLDFPENFEQVVHLTRAELASQIRLMAALKMFELGKLSSGKAAELAGVNRVEFFELCGRYRVPVFNYAPEEIESELQLDRNAARATQG
jgi:predicted HTH domain antitoxin